MTSSSLPTVGPLWAICALATLGGGGAQQQLFEATVSRVRVDVIVQDDDGAFIDDPGAAEKTLIEADLEVLPQAGRR